MKKLVVTACLLATGLAAAWCALRTDESPATSILAPPRGPTVVPSTPREVPLSRRADSSAAKSPDSTNVETPPASSGPTAQQGNVLVASVVDAEGKPCPDVLVVLWESMTGGAWPIARATTRADGTARFTGLDVNRIATVAKHALVPALPFDEPPSVDVDPLPKSDEPVRIVLPSAGRVRCEVVDDAGRFVRESHKVRLRTARSAPVRGLGGDARGIATADVDEGVARFAQVGVGLELEAEITSETGASATVARRFAGPKSAGEEVMVRIAFGARPTTIVGRIVDGDGAPVANLELVAAFMEVGTELGFGVCDPRSSTDPSGQFRFTFDRPIGSSDGAKVEIGREIRSAGTSRRIRVALVGLPEVLRVGETDVGDVVFVGGKTISGVVVTADDRPLEHVAVRAMRIDERGDRRTPCPECDLTSTDADGRFRLFVDPSAGSVAVGATLAGWAGVDGPAIAPGATGVRIVLRRAGGIGGSIRWTSEAKASNVRVFVEGASTRNGGVDERIGGRTPVPCSIFDGKFEALSLTPGVVRVVVTCGLRDDVVAAVDDVKVDAGEVSRDARLQDVDVGAGLRAAVLRVVDEEGRPVSGAWVYANGTDGDRSWEPTRATDGDGCVRIPFADDGGVDVVVVRTGRRAGAARITKDTTVVMPECRPATVRFRLTVDAPVPAPPFQLSAWLQRVEADGDDARSATDPRNAMDYDVRFGKDRAMTLTVPQPGRYVVRLVLWDDSMATTRGVALPTSPARIEVAVPDKGGGLAVVIGLDEEKLRELTSRTK